MDVKSGVATMFMALLTISFFQRSGHFWPKIRLQWIEAWDLTVPGCQGYCRKNPQCSGKSKNLGVLKKLNFSFFEVKKSTLLVWEAPKIFMGPQTSWALELWLRGFILLAFLVLRRFPKLILIQTAPKTYDWYWYKKMLKLWTTQTKMTGLGILKIFWGALSNLKSRF